MSIKLVKLFILFLFGLALLLNYVKGQEDYNTEEQSSSKMFENFQFLDRKQPFYFIADNVTVDELMTGFSHNYRIKVSVSKKVDIIVNKTFEALTARYFLEEFCMFYNLIWYFDGSILYITTLAENTNIMITLENISINQLEDAVKDSGIWDDRFKWRTIPEQSIVYISGPPRYVELVNNTIKMVDEQKARLEEKNLEVAIIRLKHISVSTEIVSLLQKMFIDDKSLLMSKGKKAAIETKEAQIPRPKEIKQAIEMASKNKPPPNAGIEAIEQLNAILVRDTPQRIELYKFLVRELDKPQQQIEINLSIIDIRVSKSDDLGILWDLNKGINPDSPLGVSLKTDSSAAGLGGAPFTLIGKNASDIIARISVLHREGNARFASRPAVLTQDNTAANLSFSNTMHVPLTSKYSNTIETISFGTSLNITPRIIDFGYKRKVSLQINITDGKGGGQAAELPVVNTASINTVATINEGESLLIGGYYTDSTVERATKFPILGDLPILGVLFKDRSNKKVKYMRMFLLQPRIISESDDHAGLIYAARDDIMKQIVKNGDTDLQYKGDKASIEAEKNTIGALNLYEKSDDELDIKNVDAQDKFVEISDVQGEKIQIDHQVGQDKIKKEIESSNSIITDNKETQPLAIDQSSDIHLMPNLNGLQNMYADFKSIFPCLNKNKAFAIIEKIRAQDEEYTEVDCITSSGIPGIRVITDYEDYYIQ